jgi:hypothetical protein
VDLTAGLEVVPGLKMHRTLHACSVYNLKIYINRRMWEVAAHTITDIMSISGKVKFIEQVSVVVMC